MTVDDAAELDALTRALREIGWVFVAWDTLNAAWQFQGTDGSRRLIAADTLAAAMRLLLSQLAARDARDA